MTPDREEALRLWREVVEIAADEDYIVIGGYGEATTEEIASALLALAADLEAAERQRDEALADLSAERDAKEAGRHLREAAERERDRLKEYEDQWNELASVEFIDYWHTIGYPCTAGTAIKAALRGLATAREALLVCLGESENNNERSMNQRFDTIHEHARDALRSLGDVD